MSLANMFREKVSKMKDYRMKSEAEFDIAYIQLCFLFLV